MDWEFLGFKHFPFSVNPISLKTLDLFTGHGKERQVCNNMLTDNNVRLIVEGARGVGTTSFANCIKFSAQAKKDYFTPSNEIRVGAGWSIETLLGVIIANIVREIELSQSQEITQEQHFQDAKALSVRIAETYMVLFAPVVSRCYPDRRVHQISDVLCRDRHVHTNVCGFDL